jgi:hypothetical protein
VAVSCDRLGAANLPPLYQAVDEADSRNKPGGALIKLNPYVIATKFVMAAGDEKKTIKKTAQQISDALIVRLHGEAK